MHSWEYDPFVFNYPPDIGRRSYCADGCCYPAPWRTALIDVLALIRWIFTWKMPTNRSWLSQCTGHPQDHRHVYPCKKLVPRCDHG